MYTILNFSHLDITTLSQSFSNSCTFAPYAEINFMSFGDKEIKSFFRDETTYEPGGYTSLFSFSIFTLLFSELLSNIGILEGIAIGVFEL